MKGLTTIAVLLLSAVVFAKPSLRCADCDDSYVLDSESPSSDNTKDSINVAVPILSEYPNFADPEDAIQIVEPIQAEVPNVMTPEAVLQLYANGCPVSFELHWLLPDPQNCNGFYYCVHGELVARNCPAGLHFNPTLPGCDWPQSAKCERINIANPLA